MYPLAKSPDRCVAQSREKPVDQHGTGLDSTIRIEKNSYFKHAGARKSTFNEATTAEKQLEELHNILAQTLSLP